MLVQPLVSFDTISLAELNECLQAWQHRMGVWGRPSHRAGEGGWFHGLRHHGRLVAVTATGDLIGPTCAGLPRSEAVELGRVCAVRPGLNRVVLRMWREFIFPALAARHGWVWAVSYQDAALHSGDLYRFDGWARIGASCSGPDRRSGRKGRRKVIWGWHVDGRPAKAWTARAWPAEDEPAAEPGAVSA